MELFPLRFKDYKEYDFFFYSFQSFLVHRTDQFNTSNPKDLAMTLGIGPGNCLAIKKQEAAFCYHQLDMVPMAGGVGGPASWNPRTTMLRPSRWMSHLGKNMTFESSLKYSSFKDLGNRPDFVILFQNYFTSPIQSGPHYYLEGKKKSLT